MECCCYLRNVQDLLPGGKTPYERRFGEPFRWPMILVGAMVEYHSISVRDQSRLHPVGKNVLPGIFLGWEPVAEEIWKGDILIADWEDFEKSDTSEIYPRRNTKEVLISQKGDAADGTAHLSGRDYDLRGPTLRREQTVRSEDLGGELQGEPGRVPTDRINMTLKPVPTSGRFKVTSSVVITMNLQFNSSCRRKKQSLFH